MRILISFTIIAFLISCHSKDDSAEPNEYAAKFVKELNTSDTFRYEFPLDSSYFTNDIDSFQYHSKKNYEKWLRLKSLEKGIDSIEIRISHGCALESRWWMIIFNHDKHKWVAEIFLVKDRFNLVEEKIDSASRTIKYDKPKSGWVNFINKLFELKLLTIEHETIIPKKEYNSPADGCGISFEVATKNSYRHYSYNNPELQSNKFWQIKNMIAIEKLLYNEFEELRKAQKKIEDEWKKMIDKSKKTPKKGIRSQIINLIDLSDTLEN
ncbi:MAG TPA: hypothetical protein PKC72_06635 [Chitinophagaceae bacterium]|mgnify:CR=1 FL=1|nr:hypothetical protein [Chitinophagaceae bacterium]